MRVLPRGGLPQEEGSSRMRVLPQDEVLLVVLHNDFAMCKEDSEEDKGEVYHKELWETGIVSTQDHEQNGLTWY